MSNLRLNYNGKLHNAIRDALRNRKRQGSSVITKKTERYVQDEDLFRAYIPERTIDSLRKDERKVDGKPDYTTLEVPYTYAMLMSLHTYLASVFLSRDPIMQYAARHGQPEMQIQAVEAIMSYQTTVGGHLVPYYIWLLDLAKYGVGIVGNYWDEEFTITSRIEEVSKTYLGIPIPGKTIRQRIVERIKGYEGNRLFNVRPQDFLFDGRVSLSNFQSGEFAGRHVTISWNDIVTREDAGQYYNIDKLRAWKKSKGSRRVMEADSDRDPGSPRLELPGSLGTGTGIDESIGDEVTTPGSVEGVELQVRLIPADWKLGKSTLPEVWNFLLAEDEIIIESAPAGNYHGKFSYGIMEYEIEGYALQKRSMFEVLNPLNDAMTWLLNSHFYNVRQILNGEFIYDPSRIDASGFNSSGGGRLLKLKPAAYGQDPRLAVHQLNVHDVTQTHLRDINILGDLMQRVSGVTDNIMGVINQGGRKTATEIRSSNSFGANRLKIQAEFNSAQGFAPISQMMLQNTQQYYTGEDKFKLAGDLMLEGQQFIQVTPEAIAGFYDFVPVDGTMPVDRFAQVTMWTQLLGQLRNFPQIAQQYDFGRIFAWIAQLGNLKNIHRFKVNVVPDEVALLNAARGNTVPLGGASGQETGGAGPSPRNATGVSGANQSPGLGPTG